MSGNVVEFDPFLSLDAQQSSIRGKVTLSAHNGGFLSQMVTVKVETAEKFAKQILRVVEQMKEKA